MRSPQSFFELQQAQRQHDERNHQDIYSLPMFGKMVHFSLHFSKYAGRLTLQKSDEEMGKELKRTFTDTFLIGLAASNAMNIDLDKQLEERFKRSFTSMNSYNDSGERMPLNQLREYSRDVLVISNGAMADTLEKRDHLDDKDSRSILVTSTLEILDMVVNGSYHLGFNLADSIQDRRRYIAELKVT